MMTRFRLFQARSSRTETPLPGRPAAAEPLANLEPTKILGAGRTTSSTCVDSKPKDELTIVCVSYQRYREVHVLINSLLCQTLNNWNLILIHDGPDPRMEAEVTPYTQRHDNIRFLCTSTRYDDYGYTLRQLGLEMADTEFVMFTNDDNYYAPKFLEYMFGAIAGQDLDLVLCNMIHSHRNPGGYRQDDYHLFDSFPELYYVDIGNFIVRTDRALSIGFADKSYAADGVFIDRLIEEHNVVSLIPSWPRNGRSRFRRKDPAKRMLRVGKVERALYVHN
jgi:hypothetical protein